MKEIIMLRFIPALIFALCAVTPSTASTEAVHTADAPHPQMLHYV
jgi:hypothetical protein